MADHFPRGFQQGSATCVLFESTSLIDVQGTVHGSSHRKIQSTMTITVSQHSTRKKRLQRRIRKLRRKASPLNSKTVLFLALPPSFGIALLLCIKVLLGIYAFTFADLAPWKQLHPNGSSCFFLWLTVCARSYRNEDVVDSQRLNRDNILDCLSSLKCTAMNPIELSQSYQGSC